MHLLEASPDAQDTRIEQMEQDLQHMAQALDRWDIANVKLADYSFHSHVIAGAENKIFERIYSTLEAFMMEEYQD